MIHLRYLRVSETSKTVNFQLVTRLEGKDAVPKLVSLLRDDSLSYPLRNHVVYSLGDIGPDVPGVIPALLDALSDRRFDRYHSAIINALTNMGAPAVKPLMERVRTTPPDARALLIRALGVLGPTAKEAIPLLEHERKDEDRQVRSAANLSLLRIAPKSK